MNAFKALFNRIDLDKVSEMVNASKEDMAAAKPVTGPLADDPIQETITFDDFAKVDMRIALIKSADFVEGSDKLLKLLLIWVANRARSSPAFAPPTRIRKRWKAA